MPMIIHNEQPWGSSLYKVSWDSQSSASRSPLNSISESTYSPGWTTPHHLQHITPRPRANRWTLIIQKLYRHQTTLLPPNSPSDHRPRHSRSSGLSKSKDTLPYYMLFQSWRTKWTRWNFRCAMFLQIKRGSGLGSLRWQLSGALLSFFVPVYNMPYHAMITL